MNGGELANMLTDGWAAIQGDALIELRKLEGAELSAVISDPPYASGGMSMGEKARSTRDKYTSFGEQGNPYPDFSGDALAQRAWTSFLHEIMAAARKACKPGAVCALFADWRQLPALTDAIQWAGWTWRGVAVWDKMNSRPQLGRFRQQCEYIVWGSNGPLPIERGVSVLPGLFQVANVPTHERWHQTQKPVDLMRQVVRLCEPGGCICDPFAGSGSTLLAALQEGYQALGIEQEAHNIAIIRKRLASIQQRIELPDGGGTGQFLFLIPACKSKKVNKAKGRSWTHGNRGYHCVGQPAGGVHCAAGWRTT